MNIRGKEMDISKLTIEDKAQISGEYFLNLLRKEKNKSKEAQSLLSSLEREKKFLSSHEVDLNKCLTLRPQKKKPKK